MIEDDLIPDDVTIQVLTQSREELIRRTFHSLRGVARAIVHLYNPTAPLFRRVVYGKDRAGIIDIATEGARLFTECAERQPGTDWRFEYSPETFTMTELDFALEICERVVDVWEPASRHPVILNLPHRALHRGRQIQNDRMAAGRLPTSTTRSQISSGNPARSS